MKLHAVWTNPFLRWCLLAPGLLIQLATLSQAATLGMVTDINSQTRTVSIDGHEYLTGPATEILMSDDSGSDEIATLFSLKAGDYVLFEEQNGRLTQIRRPAAGTLDVPAGVIAPARSASAQER